MDSEEENMLTLSSRFDCNDDIGEYQDLIAVMNGVFDVLTNQTKELKVLRKDMSALKDLYRKDLDQSRDAFGLLNIDDDLDQSDGSKDVAALPKIEEKKCSPGSIKRLYKTSGRKKSSASRNNETVHLPPLATNKKAF